MVAGDHSRDIRVRRRAATAEPVEAAPGPQRLIAVVVGIDHYADESIPDLRCAANDAESLATAIRLTQPAEALDLVLLCSPARESAVGEPTRDNICEALRRAAAIAGPGDTVVFYFAGHGGMTEGAPCLFPMEIGTTPGHADLAPHGVLQIREIQALFAACASERRVMLLDCCQSNFTSGAAELAAADDRAAALPGGVRGLQWRTGLPVSDKLVDALYRLPQGWTVLLACSPNELSLEDPDWGHHGIFSHFLAAGLRGEADLDGDGIVSLAELAQYLAHRVDHQARAVVCEAHRGEGPPSGQQGQNPTLLWVGPMSFPLTRTISEKRMGFQPEVLPLWRRYLFGPLPYPLAIVDLMRYGSAVLFGLAVFLNLLLFAPSPGDVHWIALSTALGVLSGLGWLAAIALSAAANQVGWHAGGYASSGSLALWHGVVLAIAASVGAGTAGWDSIADAVFPLAASLGVLMSLMIVFGSNAVHTAIVLGDLVNKDERVVLRRAFMQLERQRVGAEIPNRLAMVSGHPIVYEILAVLLIGLLLGHAVLIWVTRPPDTNLALCTLRDFVLVVLILWQVQWYAAALLGLRRRILPER